MILNVDRSTPEHAVHPSGSVGGGGVSAGPATEGLKGLSGRVADPNHISEMISEGVGLLTTHT